MKRGLLSSPIIQKFSKLKSLYTKTAINHSFFTHFTVCVAISVRLKPLQVGGETD